MAGWDACTGWGSIDGAKMLNMLRGAGLPPGLSVFNDRQYMAWKGIEHDQRTFWSNFDGAHWAPQQEVANVATSVGPTLAVFGAKLYMTWKGIHGDDRVFYSSFDGTTWAPQQQITGIGANPFDLREPALEG